MMLFQKRAWVWVVPGIVASLFSARAVELSKDTSPEEINQAFGIPLFSENNLWNEPDRNVAERLVLNLESKTSYESGYRLYPGEGASILGLRPFSVFLQGLGGKAARFSLIFANKGDVAAYASAADLRHAASSGDGEIPVTPQMLQAYQAAIRHEGDALREKLTDLLGPSTPATLGKVAGMEERGERWDWRGSSFILSTPRSEYVALRILPATFVDDDGAERRSFSAAREMIPKRVIHRANGDVVITDLPMVDQGAKGYCVPATYERVLRYYGLPADMNLLAMAGQTEAGGGTSVEKIAAAACELVREAGGKITTGIGGARIADIKPYIDRGQPVLWALDTSGELNERLGGRMSRRAEITDTNKANQWSETILPAVRASAHTLPRKDRHVCLIIGYNSITGEIAISDSWGPEFAERWLTEEEAQAVNQGESTVIGW